MDIFIIWIGGMVLLYFKTYQIVYFCYVRFVTCQLYINKSDKNYCMWLPETQWPSRLRIWGVANCSNAI